MEKIIRDKGNIVFYVSQNGEDSNPGTIDRPYATIERAKEAIRVLKNNGYPEGGVTVFIREGEYRLNSTLVFTEEDSGLQNAPVIYQNFNDENVILSGAVSLPAGYFTPVLDTAVLHRLKDHVKDKVVQINLKNIGIYEYGQIEPCGVGYKTRAAVPELSFNGETMIIARWPNEGYIQTESIPECDCKNGEIFQYRENETQIEGWKKDDNIWMHGYWQWDWADAMLRLDSVDTQNRFIRTAHKSCFGIDKDRRYYFFNVLEELDMPGEWYLDRKSGILYLYPPEDLKSAVIKLSLFSDPAVRLKNARNIVLQGLTIELTRGNGIEITGGENNLVAGCILRKIGKTGIVMGEIERGAGLDLGEIGEGGNGGKNNGVVGCDIYETGMGGITIAGGDRQQLIPCGNYANNNHIYNYARIGRTYRPAISLFGVGCLAAHNKIHDAAHIGIAFEGNDHCIEYNEIFNVCSSADDSGAIYTLRDWTFRGNVIRYNYIHDIVGGLGKHGTYGIYFDDCVSGIEVYSNILQNVQTAVMVHGGRDIRIFRNIIISSEKAFHLMRHHPDLIEHNYKKLVARLDNVPYKNKLWKSRYPELYNILEKNPKEPVNIQVAGNVIIDTPDGYTEDAVLKYAKIENNIMLGKINDSSKEHVQEDAATNKELQYLKIGLYCDEYRKRGE